MRTLHRGDFKPNNVISTSPGTCMCIDYDFTHVSPVQVSVNVSKLSTISQPFVT